MEKINREEALILRESLLEKMRQSLFEATKEGVFKNPSADNLYDIMYRALLSISVNVGKLHVSDIKFHIEDNKDHNGFSIVSDNIYTAGLMMGFFIDPATIKDPIGIECEIGLFTIENGKVMLHMNKPLDYISGTFSVEENKP